MYSMEEILSKKQAAMLDSDAFKQTVQEIMRFEPTQTFITEHADDLNQQMIEQSVSKLNEFKREFEAYQSGVGMANPGFRPELFINGNYIDVRYVPTDEFYQSAKRRKQKSLLSNATISRDVRHARLEDFSTQGSPDRLQLLHEIMNFVMQYQKNPYETQGLYIHGAFGVGKTYLLGAMANDLVTKNISVTMIHYPTYINELKQQLQTPKFFDMIEGTKQADVLIIDDIGAESNTQWVRDDVLNPLLEYRMRESIPTFFTSNFSFKELEHHLAATKNSDDVVKAKRIMERIRYLAKEVVFHGENLRRH